MSETDHHESTAGGGLRALRVACLASGAAALIFENAWFRAAGLVLGNSVWSAAVVTAAFMAGLGIGSLLVAAWYRRIRNIPLAYVGAELAIAVTGVVCFLLLFRGQATLAALLSPWHDLPLPLLVARLGIALGVLVGPAICIGATLPLLVGIQTGTSFGSRLAQLYAWNTLGAVAGSLACEFILIDALGLTGTALFAGAGNLVAGGVVLLWFSARRKPSPDSTGSPPPGVPAPAPVPDRPGGRRLLAAVLLLGLNLLALEVIWFRFLQLFFNGTTTTFALMLALVLIGLSLGGGAASWLIRRGTPTGTMQNLSLASGALVVLTYAAFPHVQSWVGARAGSGNPGLVLLAAFLMLPLCTVSGALFALVGEALQRFVHHPLRATGLLTLANTMGAMAGPLLAAFVLLPGLGIERTFFLIALLYGAAGFLLGAPDGPAPNWRPTLVKAGGLALILAFFPFGMMKETIYRGVAGRVPGATLLHAREGLSETSFHFRHESMGRPFYHRLLTNGYSMSASDPRSKRYMKLFAWLPLALNPDSRSALLICFGVGSTARALTDTPWLDRIDVVDISRDILEASRLIFPPPALDPLQDPRVNTRVEDGRFYLQSTPRTYDLITGEPPPTKVAGVVNLYTEEFFRLALQRLNQGGYFSYWLPVYQMQPAEARTIIRAFLNVFPEGTLWEGGGLNWILLGRRGPGRTPSAAEFGRQWDLPQVAAEMAALGLESPQQLGANFLADGPALARFCADAAPLTDLHPHRISSNMEDRSPDAAEFRELVDPARTRPIFESSPWITQAFPAEIRAGTPAFFPAQGFLNYALYPLYRPDPSTQARDTRQILQTTALRTLPILLVGSSPQELAIARDLAAAGKSSAEIEFHLSAGAMAERNYPAAKDHMRASIRANTGGAAPPIEVLANTLSGL